MSISVPAVAGLLLCAMQMSAATNAMPVKIKQQQDVSHSREMELASIRLELAEHSLGLVRTVTPVLSAVSAAVALFAAVVAMAFVSIVLYIMKQLTDLAKERKLNEAALDDIKKLKEDMESIFRQVDEAKASIRDASLRQREHVPSDEQFAQFIREVIGESPTTSIVNALKDFIWTKNIELEVLRPVLSDRELLAKIDAAYAKTKGVGKFISLSRPDFATRLSWAYEIVVNGIPLDELVRREEQIESLIARMSGVSKAG